MSNEILFPLTIRFIEYIVFEVKKLYPGEPPCVTIQFIFNLFIYLLSVTFGLFGQFTSTNPRR